MPFAEGIFRSSEVIVKTGWSDREFTKIGFSDDSHLSLPGNGQTSRIPSGRTIVLGDVLRAGTGNDAFDIDIIFHRQPQFLAVLWGWPIINKCVVPSGARRVPRQN